MRFNADWLAGATILDLTRLLPGNYCTWWLASFGADVVKVEDPGAGDYARTFGDQVDGQSAIHHLTNRGKRSIVIDLKRSKGREMFLSLAERADVVIDSFRPGVMDRLGVGHAVLRAQSERLICVSINGFGSGGSLSQAPAHDLNYQALAGHLAGGGVGLEVAADGPAWADLVGGGLIPALTIVAAMFGAQRTGRGAVIEVPMTDAVASVPSIEIANTLARLQRSPAPRCADDRTTTAHYRLYDAADCRVAVAAIEEPFWVNLCTALRLEELIPLHDDPTFQETVAARLAERFRTMTRDEISALSLAGTCVTVVNTYEEFIAWADRERPGLVRPAWQTLMRVISPPVIVDGSRPPEVGRAPTQGEHTSEVLLERGWSEGAVRAAIEDGVIQQGRAVASSETSPSACD